MQIEGSVDIVESIVLHHLSCCIRWCLWSTDHQNGLVSVERHERLHDSVRLDDLILSDWHLELPCEVLSASGLVLASTIGDENVRDLLIAWIVAF